MWVRRLAAAAAFLTLVLIVAGGLVTNTDSGLACPDWPTCFGSPMPHMIGGVAVEHTHRLIATSRADDRSLECTHVGIECLPLSHQQQQRATRHLRDRCFRRSLELLDQLLRRADQRRLVTGSPANVVYRKKNTRICNVLAVP